VISEVDGVPACVRALPGRGDAGVRLAAHGDRTPIDEARQTGIIPIRRRDAQPAPEGTVPVWPPRPPWTCGIRRRHGLRPAAGGQTVRASVRPVARLRAARRIGRDAARVFVRYTGDTRATTAALWLEPGADPDAVRPHPGGTAARRQLRDRRAAGDSPLSLRVFDRTFRSPTCSSRGVLIGLFGISASTSSQVLARRGEFGMLRHLGVTRARSADAAVEGAALGAVGVVTACCGGIVSLILIYVVNRQSFH